VEKYSSTRQATDGNLIRRMRPACWMTKATDTHSQYVILIAFPRQQWLRERALMLRLYYIACLVITETLSAVRYELFHAGYRYLVWFFEVMNE
jgi:hypothetical protein